jgi:hypothetical protein
LKVGKVAKPGHWPDTSTIRPWSTPKPASRIAVVNSAQVICGDAIPTFMPPTSRAGVGPAPHANDRCLLA